MKHNTTRRHSQNRKFSPIVIITEAISSFISEVAGVTFWDPDSAPVPKFLNPGRDPGRLIFKFEKPTPVQTPATIIDPTVIYPCFYLNDHTDSCYSRNGKVIPDPVPVFHKFLTQGPDPGPNEKDRILPESTPVIRIRPHLWIICVQTKFSIRCLEIL